MSGDNYRVIEHLEEAIEVAQEQGMTTSELIGLLFYYAHNVAQEARESALHSQQVQREEQE